MSVADVGIFKLAEQRLAWAANRQQVLAHNVANASTPGYLPRDVASFKAVLAQTNSPPLSQTSPAHLGAVTQVQSAARTGRPTDRAPDGNAVSLEEQLTKVADTASTQELAINLYKKYQGMFRIALGRGGS